MKKKYDGYTLVSPFAASFGLAVTEAASMNSFTAPFANSIGTLATGIVGGINLKNEEKNIKEKFDDALNETWDLIISEYKLTPECFIELKQEVIGEGTSTSEFVDNLQRKKLKGSLTLVIQTILERHRENLNWYSELTWDDEYIESVSIDISSRLINTLTNVFNEDDLLKILKAIADRSESIRGDIYENREEEKLEHDQIIKALEEIDNSLTLKRDINPSEKFSSYYEYVKRRFTRKQNKDFERLVGSYSIEEAYIDSYFIIKKNYIRAISYLEKWYDEENYGVVLIYGEPGHGKTTLCDNVTVSFDRGLFLKGKAKNVLTVSLNTGDNRRIIENGNVNLKNALIWGSNKDHSFSFDDCRGSLLFMDGFDEFIDEAKGTNIKNIWSFMNVVNDIASEYDFHIAVLSRTIAIANYIGILANSNFKCCALAPITDKQQDDWLEKHSEYADYYDTFNRLRNNANMRDLLRIPLLFRLIVHNRFDTVSSNIVSLYDDLFKHLMVKRGIFGEKFDSVNLGLMNLAFEIYCTDTDMTLLKEEDWNQDWVFAFYVKTAEGRKIGFFHRTFYQYFLAKYIYTGILNITNESSEFFIGLFAERELDSTVLEYLNLLFNEKNKRVAPNIKLMFEALSRTEAYLNFIPKNDLGDAEVNRILRSTNIYRNVLHIAAAVPFVIHCASYNNLDIIMRTFSSADIKLCSNNNNRANFSGIDLHGADLRRADLSNINLSGADLSGADLSNSNLSRSNLSGAILHAANLCEANLSNAILREAHLSKAVLYRAKLCDANLIGAHMNKAYLKKADLCDTDLSKADLSDADLRSAKMRGATLCGADISKADLSGANLSRTDLRVSNLTSAKINKVYKPFFQDGITGGNTVRWI